MAFWNNKKAHYPKEQLEIHKTALELKGVAINLQRTVDELEEFIERLKSENTIENKEDKNV